MNFTSSTVQNEKGLDYMIALKNLSVSYDGKKLAVNNINLHVKEGEILGVIGSSGSGKSSMLKTINRLVEPSSASHVIIDGDDITNYSEKQLRNVRRKIGMIFQDYNLVDRSSVLDNVLIGRLGYKNKLDTILSKFTNEEYEAARKSLMNLGLEDKIFERADQLSGGQKQRVAISKALTQKPKIILADEPVASLDVATSKVIMEYLKKVNEKKNITIVINLHDVNLAKKYCSRIIGLHKGEILFDGKAGELDDRLLERIYL